MGFILSSPVEPTPREVLRAEFGDGKNLMTPHVIEERWLGRSKRGRTVVVELARGDFLAKDLFGVTFVKVTITPSGWKTERMIKESGVFYTLSEAKKRIKEFREEV